MLCLDTREALGLCHLERFCLCVYSVIELTGEISLLESLKVLLYVLVLHVISLDDMEAIGKLKHVARLTDLKGKVVMLEFNVYDHPMSAVHVFILRELHDMYASQGFEIYQVSLDENEHFWKTAVENIPWVCVRPDEAPYSKEATLYGVRELPTYFLINRAGEIVKRDEMVEDLEMEIRRLLME